MSRLLRISAVFALIAALAATAAFLMPASTETATAEAPDLGLDSLEEGLFQASTSCMSDQIEITCAIDSDPCGRTFSTTGCCENDEEPSCAPIISPSNPTCWAGFSITCN